MCFLVKTGQLLYSPAITRYATRSYTAYFHTLVFSYPSIIPIIIKIHYWALENTFYPLITGLKKWVSSFLRILSSQKLLTGTGYIKSSAVNYITYVWKASRETFTDKKLFGGEWKAKVFLLSNLSKCQGGNV